MKTLVVILLTSLWTMALIVPSVYTLLDGSGKSWVVMNLNEEEPQQGQQDLQEKQIIPTDPSFMLQAYYASGRTLTDAAVLGASHPLLEIVLPPPKFLS